MAWLTLALRKQTLKAEINDLNCEDLQLSRSLRSVHRNLAYEQSIFNNQKKSEIREAKSAYDEVRDKRSSFSTDDKDSTAYKEWQKDYEQAKEDYQEKKLEIEEYYDDKAQELEQEAQDEEDLIQDQIVKIETQRDAESAELQAITDQIKTEIESSAIKF